MSSDWSRLVPAGIVVDGAVLDGDVLVITAHVAALSASCPLCGSHSWCVRSRYWRKVSDLPAGGRQIELRVRARRFRCNESRCRRRIFAERLPAALPSAFGRRTVRLDAIARHVGLLLGGRPGESLARRLRLPVSKDTLLRLVRRPQTSSPPPLRVVGIDDWAWRRGHRYGTIVCDLEQRRVAGLLPDREPATVAAWLAARPAITVVARDRGGGYGAAVTMALPRATQVADRWHLMENASAAFLMAVRRCMRAIRAAVAAGPINPTLLTSAQRRQFEGWLRRQDAEHVMTALSRSGAGIREIARRTSTSREVVRRVLRGGRSDVFRPRASSLEPWRERLEAEWSGGCRNGAELWRRLRSAGFSGGLRVVTEWATRRRAEEKGALPGRVPTARAIARLMTSGRGRLTPPQVRVLCTIETAVPELVHARDTIDAFHRMVRRRDGTGLEDWLSQAATGLVASFARGIAADLTAIRAAITVHWSNGQTEGQITKLKLIRRQMYGRGKLDLLQARLMHQT